MATHDEHNIDRRQHSGALLMSVPNLRKFLIKLLNIIRIYVISKM